MDVLVAGATDNQGLTVAGCHRFDPGRLFRSPRTLEVFQCPDMVDLKRGLGAAEFTRLCEESLNEFDATTPEGR